MDVIVGAGFVRTVGAAEDIPCVVIAEEFAKAVEIAEDVEAAGFEDCGLGAEDACCDGEGFELEEFSPGDT
jgi:hypothetical protein